MTLQPSDYIAGLSIGTGIFFAVRSNSVSKEFAALSQRVALLESLHQGHEGQIAEIKVKMSEMGLQLNELYRQMVAVQEKLQANTNLFTNNFERLFHLLEK
jgi:uncharacterized coiled-coil protein SlyX